MDSKVPPGWNKSQLGKVVSLVYGKGLPASDREGGSIPVYGSNGVVGWHEMACVQGPGIVVGRKGSIGSVAWSPTDFWPIDTTYYVVPNGGATELRWLYYLLNSLDLVRLNSATGTPGLNREEAYQLPVLLPPLPEQRKIAEVLSSVDDAMEKTEAIIRQVQVVKRGLMQHLLTRGIPGRHSRFKQTEVGEIPEEWKVMRLEEVCVDKPAYGANAPAREFSPDLPRYVRITDISDNGNLSNENLASIEMEAAKDYILQEGDFMFARSGATVGKTYLYKSEDGVCAYAGYLIRVRPAPHFLVAKYLSHLTHSNAYQDWVKGMLRAGAQPNINAKEYAAWRLPLPPLKEQAEICSVIDTCESYAGAARKSVSELQRLKTALMQALLAGEVRVKVEL